jgi:light-regulated signal transduction histidine kinase (bacteriophytochrome)
VRFSPTGALLVLQASSGIIEAASVSCEALLGVSAESMLGQAVGMFFGSTAGASILSSVREPHEQLIQLSLHGNNLVTRPLLNAGGQILVDIEAS